MKSCDQTIMDDNWSDLSQIHPMPDINTERLHRYRMQRLRDQMKVHDVSVCVLTSPISIRYAINYRSYALFMAHIPSTYVFIAQDAPYVIHNGLDAPNTPASQQRKGRGISHFYAGDALDQHAKQFAEDIDRYLVEIGSRHRKVAVEYVNPSITKALLDKDIEVIDGVLISENARIIKSEDELSCMRWSIAVAEHAARQVKKALKPGVSELQLWGLINYTNLANNGDWHDSRMLASGPRINPWLQEATHRKVESGDLVGFDTDMVGPNGYCADLSRTYLCGPAKATKRQKQLYRLAVDEIEHNLRLVKAGVSFKEFQQNAYPIPEEFQQNAYTCVMHGVGMCDEYPHLYQGFRESPAYDDYLREGMVVCIESYMGAVGERDGVKLEQQVLVTKQGYDMLTTLPYEDELM